MAWSTMRPREPHNENQRSSSSEHSIMRPESTTSARSARSPPPGSKHRLSADGQVRSAEAVQALEDLEAETGFPSYSAYLESLGDNPAYQGFSWNNANNLCAIIDLFKEEASPPKAGLRCENLSADQTLQSLRTPPRGVAVQIVFWSSDKSWSWGLHRDFVTVFGLGLKLDPLFFQAFAAGWTRGAFLESEVDEHFLPEYFFADGAIVAIARDCPLVKPGGPPVLLIAALVRLDYHIDTTALYYLTREAPPNRTPGGKQPSLKDPRLYAWLLTASMNQNPDCTISCEALLFGALLPLLQLDILRMRARFSHVRAKFQEQKWFAIQAVEDEIEDEIDNVPFREPFDDDTVDDRLYRHRAFLRSLIVTFEGSKEPLVRFITSQLAPELTTAPAYNRIAEERGSILKTALSLEAEIRDFLQVQAGQLSLLESRKSIEVSNNQLQEGKRVKIFTILAFIYVPLNLATSIFGMNIEQLNGSGKSVGYFVVTALVALIITGGSWWITEQWSSLRAWRKRDPESYKGLTTFKSYGRSAPNYSILVRAAMLTWLVTHGYSSWMVRSRAGWCALTNSTRGFRDRGRGREGLFAGDYLSKFIRPDYNQSDFWMSSGQWYDRD